MVIKSVRFADILEQIAFHLHRVFKVTLFKRFDRIAPNLPSFFLPHIPSTLVPVLAISPMFERMTKGSSSGVAGGIGKRNATTEEKGKRAAHCTRVGMDFDLKTTGLDDQEVIDEYLTLHV